MNLRHRLILPFCLLLSISGFAQKIFTPKEIKQDMLFLKQRFVDMHPGMYYYTSPAEYDSIFNRLYNNVEQNMTYQEVFQYIAPLVTMVKDGHTSYKFKKKKYGKKPKLFPFYIQGFDDNYYIAYNGTSDTTLVRGTKLLSINNESIPLIINKLQSIYGTDNDNPSSKVYYSQRAFNVFYFKYYGPSDSLKISYQLPESDSLITTYIQCLPQDKIILNVGRNHKNATRKNFDYKLVDSTGYAAKLDITSFSMKGKFFDFGQFKFNRALKNRFQQIRQDSVRNLIVDFRGNGGGFIPNIARFTKYVAKEPFVLLDTTFFKKKAMKKVAPFYTIFSPVITRILYKPYDETFYYRKTINPKVYKPIIANHFDGNIFFLMDGGSYSATTFTMALAYDMGLGTYVGQRPGGANWGSFAATWNDFKLPNSKIVVHMPLYKLTHNLPNKKAKTFTLMPDYEVNYNFKDFLERKDSVLEFTLDLIK